MGSLDWRDSSHWSPRHRPCRHCGAPTNLRDAAGRPSHKVCAERAVDRLREARTQTLHAVPTESEAS